MAIKKTTGEPKPSFFFTVRGFQRINLSIVGSNSDPVSTDVPLLKRRCSRLGVVVVMPGPPQQPLPLPSLPGLVCVPPKVVGSEADQNPRRRQCNCRRSNCLKLYVASTAASEGDHHAAAPQPPAATVRPHARPPSDRARPPRTGTASASPPGSTAATGAIASAATTTFPMRRRGATRSRPRSSSPLPAPPRAPAHAAVHRRRPLLVGFPSRPACPRLAPRSPSLTFAQHRTCSQLERNTNAFRPKINQGGGNKKHSARRQRPRMRGGHFFHRCCGRQRCRQGPVGRMTRNHHHHHHDRDVQPPGDRRDG